MDIDEYGGWERAREKERKGTNRARDPKRTPWCTARCSSFLGSGFAKAEMAGQVRDVWPQGGLWVQLVSIAFEAAVSPASHAANWLGDPGAGFPRGPEGP